MSEECYSFLELICHTILITNKMTMYFLLKEAQMDDVWEDYFFYVDDAEGHR